MTFEQNFKKLKNIFMKADVSQLTEELAFQFNITGDGSGSFYVKLSGGKLEVEPYEYYDRDVAFSATATTFTKLANYQLDPVLAFTVGKLKVDGPIEKALILGKIVKKD